MNIRDKECPLSSLYQFENGCEPWEGHKWNHTKATPQRKILSPRGTPPPPSLTRCTGSFNWFLVSYSLFFRCRATGDSRTGNHNAAMFDKPPDSRYRFELLVGMPNRLEISPWGEVVCWRLRCQLFIRCPWAKLEGRLTWLATFYGGMNSEWQESCEFGPKDPMLQIHSMAVNRSKWWQNQCKQDHYACHRRFM